MGVLRDFNLQSYIDQGYTILAETGTGTGTGVEYATRFKFDSILSCEIDVEHANKLSDRYKAYDVIKIYPDPSELFIWKILENRYVAKRNIVWFLDAHFPSFDLKGAAIDAEKNLDVRLPLQKELDLLQKYNRVNDIIIIDDLRIYEHGPFEGKNMDEIGYAHAAAYDRPLNLEFWKETHNIERIYKDTGYLYLTPKTFKNERRN